MESSTVFDGGPQLCTVCNLNDMKIPGCKVCTDCMKYFCQECTDAHLKTPVYQTHAMKIYHRYFPACATHATGKADFYCNECKKYQCVVCVMEDNAGHQKVHVPPLNEAVSAVAPPVAVSRDIKPKLNNSEQQVTKPDSAQEPTVAPPVAVSRDIKPKLKASEQQVMKPDSAQEPTLLWSLTQHAYQDINFFEDWALLVLIKDTLQVYTDSGDDKQIEWKLQFESKKKGCDLRRLAIYLDNIYISCVKCKAIHAFVISKFNLKLKLAYPWGLAVTTTGDVLISDRNDDKSWNFLQHNPRTGNTILMNSPEATTAKGTDRVVKKGGTDTVAAARGSGAVAAAGGTDTGGKTAGTDRVVKKGDTDTKVAEGTSNTKSLDTDSADEPEKNEEGALAVADTNAEKGTREASESRISFKHPIYLFCDDNNRIVSDYDKNKVYALDDQGKLRFTFEGTELKGPRGVCAYSGGDYLVADNGNKRVCQFTSKGEYVGDLLTHHAKVGTANTPQCDGPWSVEFVQKGEMKLLGFIDLLGKRVQIIQL